MKKLILFALSAIILSIFNITLATIVFDNPSVIVDFSRQRYNFQKPTLYGGKGVMLTLSDKQTGEKNFAFALGGFAYDETNFQKACRSNYKSFQRLKGKISKLVFSEKNDFKKCSFEMDSPASFDTVEMTFDKKEHRYFSFSGLLLKRKNKDTVTYKKEFKNLADKIVYNYAKSTKNK